MPPNNLVAPRSKGRRGWAAACTERVLADGRRPDQALPLRECLLLPPDEDAKDGRLSALHP